MAHWITKGKRRFRAISVRFNRADTDITVSILKNDLARCGCTGRIIIIQKVKMTPALFKLWKRRGTLEYYGGSTKKMPAFRYDIYVREPEVKQIWDEKRQCPRNVR